ACFGDTNPHVDAGTDQPEGEEDLYRSRRRWARASAACHSADNKAQDKQQNPTQDDLERVHAVNDLRKETAPSLSHPTRREATHPMISPSATAARRRGNSS